MHIKYRSIITENINGFGKSYILKTNLNKRKFKSYSFINFINFSQIGLYHLPNIKNSSIIQNNVGQSQRLFEKKIFNLTQNLQKSIWSFNFCMFMHSININDTLTNKFKNFFKVYAFHNKYKRQSSSIKIYYKNVNIQVVCIILLKDKFYIKISFGSFIDLDIFELLITL